jgi:hypothetical protein
MAWITLTEAHVTACLSGVELAAWRKAALAAGQDDPVQATLNRVTNEVRGYIRASMVDALDAGNTIPDELLDSAMALVVAKLATRLPIPLTQERKEARDAAMDQLKDVAARRFRLSSTVTPSDDQPGGVELASGDGNTPSAASLNGLF